MQQLLLSQYDSIRSARHALFSYCKRFDNSDLFKNVEAFNNNIAHLLTHVANSYLHWMIFFDQQIPEVYFNKVDVAGMEDIENMYKQVDTAVYNFIEKYKGDYEQSFTKNKSRINIPITTTPLALFTHVITHEFHHKGQILTMSRLLGYTPVDTDVIRY